MSKSISLKTTTNKDGIKIVIIGVGGGGTAVVNELIRTEALKNVKFATIDDAFSINSLAPHNLSIDKSKDIFCYYTVKKSRADALKHYDEIKELLTKFDKKNEIIYN